MFYQTFKEKRHKLHLDFYDTVRDLAKHPVVRQMRLFPQHGDTNCYRHCLNVAFYNYLLCRLLHLDARSAARAAMLHDLFLYDWHTHAAQTGEHFHGLTHPRTAYENARKHFHLNPTEKDVILTHMWPVTPLAIPHTPEGWITIFSDKYCGACETGHRRKLPRHRNTANHRKGDHLS